MRPEMQDYTLSFSGNSRMLVAASLAMVMLFAGAAVAETYKWSDANGNLCFTDDPAAVPRKYRGKVTTNADITLADPDVRREVEEGRRVAAILKQEDLERSKVLRRREVEEESRRKQVELKVQAEKRAAEASVKTAQAPKKRRLS